MRTSKLLDLIGKPFKNGARGPDYYDCWGLVKEVHKRFGIELPDFPIDAFNCSTIDLTVEEEKTKSKWQKLDIPVVPCVVLLKNHPKYVNHLGVYISNGLFIHAMDKVGVIIDRIDCPQWRMRVMGYYKYVG